MGGDTDNTAIFTLVPFAGSFKDCSINVLWSDIYNLRPTPLVNLMPLVSNCRYSISLKEGFWGVPYDYTPECGTSLYTYSPLVDSNQTPRASGNPTRLTMQPILEKHPGSETKYNLLPRSCYFNISYSYITNEIFTGDAVYVYKSQFTGFDDPAATSNKGNPFGATTSADDYKKLYGTDLNIWIEVSD
jgi:hypothetical protein